MDGNGSLFGTLSGNTREVRTIHRPASGCYDTSEHLCSWAGRIACRIHVHDHQSLLVCLQPPRGAVAHHMTLCGGAWLRADPAQVHGGPAQEARAGRAVRAALCAPAPGEAAQLRAEGAACNKPVRGVLHPGNACSMFPICLSVCTACNLECLTPGTTCGRHLLLDFAPHCPLSCHATGHVGTVLHAPLPGHLPAVQVPEVMTWLESRVAGTAELS